MPIPIQEEKDGQDVFSECVAALLNRKGWFIGPFICGILLSVLLILFLPKTYRSTTLIIVEDQKIPQEFVRSTISAPIEERLSTIRQQVLSRSFLEKIIDQFGLFKNDKDPMEEKVESMRKVIDIKTMGGERVNAFSISYIGSDPMTTMKVTNELASLLIKENLKIREELVEGTSAFIDGELENLKITLESQERALSQFKQSFTGELPTQIDASLRTLDRLQLALQETKASIRATQPDEVLLVDPLYQEWLTQKQRLVALQRKYNDNHPDLIVLKKEVKSLEDRVLVENAKRGMAPTRESGLENLQSTFNPLSLRVQADIADLRLREKQIQAQIEDFERRIENAPKREQELAILDRDYENTRKNYQSLLDKKLTARISENLEKRQKGEQFRVVDAANYPEKAYRPNPLKMAILGCLIGIGGGIALVFFKETMDTSVRKPEDFEKLSDIPVLASILNHDVFHQQMKRKRAEKGKNLPLST